MGAYPIVARSAPEFPRNFPGIYGAKIKAQILAQLPARPRDNHYNSAALPHETKMNPMTLTNIALTTALATTIEALKVPHKSAVVQAARERNLFALKAEAARRVRLGAF